MKKEFSKIIILCILYTSLICAYTYKTKQLEPKKPENKIEQIEDILKNTDAAKKTFPDPVSISVKIPPFLNYAQTINQLKQWQSEAPELVEVDTYGQTKSHKDLYYIRVHNRFDKTKKPVVLITAAIHGNEPWSSSITMAYIGNIIDQYAKSKEITDMINSRDLYFIPIVSPDSYPTSRTVGNIDPNRDFPTPKNNEHQSIPEIMALREFYFKINPSAVISGHTYGRIFMTPYGDTHQKSPHEADYNRIVGKMAEMANYKKIHCVELYGKPIDGSEVDWFYRNGSISICAEYGTHQNKPTNDEIKSEFMRVKDAINFFVNEAPNISVKVNDEGVDFSKNTGISRKYARLPNGDLVPVGPYQNPD